MQLLGYMNVNDGYPESGVNVKIDGGATEGKTCTLIIEGIDLNSSGFYFCAASRHSATCHCFSVQKPPDSRFLSSETSSSLIVAPAWSPFYNGYTPMLSRFDSTTETENSAFSSLVWFHLIVLWVSLNRIKKANHHRTDSLIFVHQIIFKRFSYLY